jgi:hypothetical protein
MVVADAIGEAGRVPKRATRMLVIRDMTAIISDDNGERNCVSTADTFFRHDPGPSKQATASRLFQFPDRRASLVGNQCRVTCFRETAPFATSSTSRFDFGIVTGLAYAREKQSNE